jgi:hypothetical protein
MGGFHRLGCLFGRHSIIYGRFMHTNATLTFLSARVPGVPSVSPENREALAAVGKDVTVVAAPWDENVVRQQDRASGCTPSTASIVQPCQFFVSPLAMGLARVMVCTTVGVARIWGSAWLTSLIESGSM